MGAVVRVFVFALVAFGMGGPRAHADSSTSSSLSWVRGPGAEDCPSTRQMGRTVEALLGRRVFVSASEADVSVEVHVTRPAGAPSYRARMVVSDPEGANLGTRRMADPACVVLAEQLALAIAITIDPAAAFVELPEELALDPERDPADDLLRAAHAADRPPGKAPAGRVRQAVRPPPAPGRRRSPPRSASGRGPVGSAALTASAQLGLGLQPGVSLGAGLDFLWRPAWLRLDLAYWSGRSVTLDVGQLDVTLLQAGLALCPPLGEAPGGEVRMCGGVNFGSLHLRARNVPSSGPFWRETADLRAGLRYEGRLSSSWAAVLQLELGFPLVRDRFHFVNENGDSSSVYRLDALIGRAALGLAWSF